MKTRVTIGIPTYDRLSYLKEAISAALAQTYPETEILISQNPHDDPRIREPIAEYCRQLAANNPKIRYQIHSRNIGAPANYNSIADSANGEFLSLIGDDDRQFPDAVERLLKAAAPDTTVVFGKVYVINANGEREPSFTTKYHRAYGRERIRAGLVANPEVWAWQQSPAVEASLIRTSDFRSVRFREDVDMPDIGLFIYLARRGSKFTFLPEYVCEYRFHPNSQKAMRFHSMRELVDEFSVLQVGPEVEPYKRAMLRNLAFNGASRCLLVGEVAEARRLMRNEYYPGLLWSGPKGLLMRCFALLPDQLAGEMYNALYALKNRRRYETARI